MAKRKVVVVIEDDTDIADLECRLLAPYCECRCITHDFEQVKTDATWEDVHVGIFDLMLPYHSGQELLEWVWKHHPEVRRVICTAMPISELQSVATYADYVLLKPFTPQQLVEAVLEG